jgi:PPM family protein phosphatase
MNFEYAGLSDAGMLRKNNEDAFAFDSATGVAVLADGMGGYNAGEIASAMAVTFVKTELSHFLGADSAHRSVASIRQAIETAVINANLAIYNASVANPHFSGMGTTLVLGVFRADKAILAHVGDSRCYLRRNGQLTQLTRDHSLLQEQIDAGLLSAEEAKGAAHKNLVTRALGVDAHVVVDIIEHTPLAGDIYLMCSDGLSDMVDDGGLTDLLSENNNLPDQTSGLVRTANEAGGRDNISVILIRAGAAPEAQSFLSRLLGKA